LPSSRLGIDVENDFLPDYEIMDSRKGTVNSLKKAAKNCEALYLAPDPDREGEAIAWHLANTLGVPPEKTFRVTFNEITKKAVQDAFNSPSKIDESKVNAQQARRIWDRLVGYKISPILWKKVAKGLSAGRVQSVAVRLVVEREREIAAFNPEEYWRILATLSAQAEGSEKFIAELRKLDNEDVGLGKKVHIKSEEEATALREELEKADYKVVDIRKKRQKNNPVPPFITSTLQQQASTRAGYTAQRTMRIAQQLYEGMEVGGEEGPVGLITYMRTDSVRISDEALASARELIGRDFGPKYLPEEPNFYKSKSGAQEAHEAIRPTDVERTPEKMKQYLDNDQFKLYKLVWDRTVASQMTPAEYDITEVDITAGRALFLARGRVMLFDGHLRVSGMPAAKKSKKKKSEEEDDSGPDLTNQVLPPLENDEELDLKE
ncbi:MAG: type I DNA topoisomerase, partial [Planctomycetota bacterium]|nr:type I DNA topoisomerase [Planctomycetota bacterium]